MGIHKDIPELLNSGTITQETADKINSFYSNKGSNLTNRLFIVFGILGAVLVGLGIILILAHNWDQLGHITKTTLAFTPLLIGHLLCLFVLFRQQNSISWRESSSAFLFFAIGSSISLISQIYNIPGNLDTFLLTWMLISLPIVYLMNSSITSLLYIIGITYYAFQNGYSYRSVESYNFWLLLLMILPFYYLLYRKKSEGNFMIFHNWFIPGSLAITLGIISHENAEIMYVAYFSLFGLFFLLGNINFFNKQSLINNGYKIIGTLGTLVMLLMLSFNWFWKDLHGDTFIFIEIIKAPEMIASAIITLLATWLLYKQVRIKSIKEVQPLSLVFLLFIVAFIVGLYSSFIVVLINLIILVLGIISITEGSKRDHLGIINFGLLIITALVACRFFDTDLSFVIRGMMFMIVGTSFFIINYRMLQKRKLDE